VQKTIQDLASQAGPPVEILRTYEDGKVVFEFVSGSGAAERTHTIVGKGVVTSREISKNEVPQKVLKRSSAVLKGAVLKQCFYSEEDKEPFFTFATEQASGPRWLTFDSRGDLTEEEELAPWDSLPEPVQNAIVQKLGAKEKVRALRFKDGETTHFEVWAFHAGKLVMFWVSSNGAVSETAPEH
jgi:hypothetical protein